MIQIAVLGPDGAGKSTLIAALIELLSRSGKVVEVVHFRARLLGRSPRPPVTEPYARDPHPIPIAALKVLGWHLAHLLWSLAPRRAGTIVVFDRSLLDVGLDPRRYRVPPTVAQWAWSRLLIPKPTLVFVMSPDAEILRARKREVSEEESVEQVTRYAAARFEGLRVLRLSAVRAPSEVAAEIVRELEAQSGRGT